MVKSTELDNQPGTWIERWYGSGEERGWWIVKDRTHIAHLGADVHSAIVHKVVATHNDELRHLLQIEQCLNEWLDKTQWVQTSVQPHEWEMHRTDVISQRFAEITKQRDDMLVALKECMVDADNYEARTCKKLVGGWPQKAREAIAKVTGEVK